MSESLQNQKYSWKSLAEIWQDLKPPLRPSKPEIKIYERYLQKVIQQIGPKLKILLFGVTPELRDLFAKYKCEVTMVDINPAMVKATDKLVKSKKRQENVIIADWLKFRLNRKFDVVCGDHIFSNVPFEEHERFCQNIKRHLKTNGFVIINIHLKALFIKLSLKEFVQKFQSDKKLRTNKEEKWFWIYNLIYNNSKFWQESKQGSIWPSVGELRHQAWQDNIQLPLEEIAEITENIYLPKRFISVFPRREIFEKIFTGYFQILDSDINKKHPVYKSYRIYFAKPKK